MQGISIALSALISREQ